MLKSTVTGFLTHQQSGIPWKQPILKANGIWGIDDVAVRYGKNNIEIEAEAYKAFDDTISTCVNNFNTGAYIELCSLTAIKISRVVLTSYDGYLAKSGTISYSNDGVNFTECGSWIDTSPTSTIAIAEINSNSAYHIWRFTSTGDSLSIETNVTEIKIIAQPAENIKLNYSLSTESDDSEAITSSAAVYASTADNITLVDVKETQLYQNAEGYLRYADHTYNNTGIISSSSQNGLGIFNVAAGETYRVGVHMLTRFRVGTLAALTSRVVIDNLWIDQEDTNGSTVVGKDKTYDITIPDGHKYLLVGYWSGASGQWTDSWNKLTVHKIVEQEETDHFISGNTSAFITYTPHNGVNIKQSLFLQTVPHIDVLIKDLTTYVTYKQNFGAYINNFAITDIAGIVIGDTLFPIKNISKVNNITIIQQ